MKKKILRVLLVICGLNVFTACYGMPPGDLPEPEPLPEEQDQTKAPFVSVSSLKMADEGDALPSDAVSVGNR